MRPLMSKMGFEVTTLEQQARDILERMEIENAQSFSSGELVEIANLLNRVSILESALKDDIKALKECDESSWSPAAVSQIVREQTEKIERALESQ